MSQNYHLEKRGTVGDRVQMICVLMEMKCTEKYKHLEEKCAIPKINKKWSGLNCESCDLSLRCIW